MKWKVTEESWRQVTVIKIMHRLQIQIEEGMAVVEEDLKVFLHSQREQVRLAPGVALILKGV